MKPSKKVPVIPSPAKKSIERALDFQGKQFRARTTMARAGYVVVKLAAVGNARKRLKRAGISEKKPLTRDEKAHELKINGIVQNLSSKPRAGLMGMYKQSLVKRVRLSNNWRAWSAKPGRLTEETERKILDQIEELTDTLEALSDILPLRYRLIIEQKLSL